LAAILNSLFDPDYRQVDFWREAMAGHDDDDVRVEGGPEGSHS